MMRIAALALILAGCLGGGSAPELANVTDPVAVVGTELVLDLDGTDADGDRLSYRFEALDLDLDGRASIALTPSGAGVFRWTPLAGDLGEHAIDFIVSDGDLETTVTVMITVVDPITAPVFRAPLGSGTTLDLDIASCLDVDVVVEDPDSAQVTLSRLDAIGGATLDQRDGLSATWSWCPTVEQRAITRHTIVLAADDGEHPPTIKNYIIVLRGGGGPGPAICTDDAREDDDTPAQARETSYPSHASTGDMVCAGDDDWYLVPLFTGEQLAVDLTFAQANPQEDLDLHLVRDGVDLTPCDVATPELCTIEHGQSADSNEHTAFTVPTGCDSGCDYYVVVRGYDGSSAPYAISITID
jgi:hypothetical protein